MRKLPKKMGAKVLSSTLVVFTISKAPTHIDNTVLKIRRAAGGARDCASNVWRRYRRSRSTDRAATNMNAIRA